METTSINKDYLEGVIDREFGPDIEKTRTVRFVISTSAKDRHNSVLNMKGWKLDNFNRNPIVGYQHNVYGDNMCTPPNPDDVLGPARAWIENDRLMGEVTFETADINPQAEKVFRKVLNGTLRATSVGFLEVGQGKNVLEKDEKGKVIGGLRKTDHALVFHAGTRQKDQDVLTDGGRVLAVSGKGTSLEEARKQAYAAASQIQWDGLYYRQDIGQDLLAYKG